MSNKILFDTGFWYGLFDSADAHHEAAQKVYARYERHLFLIPYPSLYEFMNTAFCRNYFDKFYAMIERRRRRGLVDFIDDLPYRNDLLKILYHHNVVKKRERGMSAVDAIIREIIISRRNFVFVTNNIADFHDVCYKSTVDVIDLSITPKTDHHQKSRA